MEKILAAYQIASGLFQAGAQIMSLLKNKDSLTNEELQTIIDKQNAAQATARNELTKLLG